MEELRRSQGPQYQSDDSATVYCLGNTMMRRRRMDRILRQALRARSFALRALSPSASGKPVSEHPDDIFFSTEGWHLFVRVERCALHLQRVMEETGLWSRIPPAFAATLAREAEWERRHVASARRQLRVIGEWGLANDCRPVVLKGGVNAVGPECVDLNDIDILLPEERAKRLTDSLVHDGYRRSAHSSVDHFRGLSREGEILIEIHPRIIVIETHHGGYHETGLQEIPEIPGLWRLASVDHVWHILTHIVAGHPARRGRIRDLLLLRHAVATCSEADLQAVVRRVEGHELTDALRATLRHALQWLKEVPTDDPFRDVALASYMLGLRRSNRSRIYPISGRINQCVFGLLLGPVERRAVWKEVGAEFADFSGHRSIRSLQRVNPQIAGIVHDLARVVTRAVSFARAWPVAASIRRRSARYRDHSTRETGMGGTPAVRPDA